MRVTRQEIQEITGVEDAEQLTEISLSNRYVDQLGFVCEMVWLQELNISFNDLYSLQGIAGCRSLRVLTVVHNRLRNLDGIQGLDDLRCLRCSKNNIIDISAVGECPRLQELCIQDNKIPHISDVVDNLGALAELQKLMVVPNPFVPCAALSSGAKAEGAGQSETWRQYTLCSLRHLLVLDGQPVNDDDRSVAEKRLQTLEGSEALHVLLDGPSRTESPPAADTRSNPRKYVAPPEAAPAHGSTSGQPRRGVERTGRPDISSRRRPADVGQSSDGGTPRSPAESSGRLSKGGDESYYKPVRELITWINKLLQLEYRDLDDFVSGTAHCQVIDMLHPGILPIWKVNFSAQMEHECVANYKLLQRAFNKC
eukprot:SAG31_NODE_476_length_15154_cov_24.796878_1_plen_367_part_10